MNGPDLEVCAAHQLLTPEPLYQCGSMVIGHVELGGERRALCRLHTTELARVMLDMGFEIELASGRTAAELSTRLDRRVVEALERRRVREAMR